MENDVPRIMGKISFVEIVILVVGLIIAIAGFLMINTLYVKDGKISWEMVLAVFNWLTVFGIIILSSLIYYNLKTHLAVNDKFGKEVLKKIEETKEILKKK